MPYLKKNLFGVTFIIVLRVMNAPAGKLLCTAMMLASNEVTGDELRTRAHVQCEGQGTNVLISVHACLL